MIITTNTDQNRPQPPPRVGIMTVLVLGLVVAGVVTTAYAQEYETVHANIHAEVTDITMQRGVFLDHWVFTVKVTNNDSKEWIVGVSELWLENEYGWPDFTSDELWVRNQCNVELTIDSIDSSDTGEVVGCFATTNGVRAVPPTAVMLAGFSVDDDVLFYHLLPFVPGECDYVFEEDTCQSVQNIDHLIRIAERESESEPEPMCEVPTVTTAPDPIDTQQPQLLTAAYHKIFGELVLSFDESVTLADGWQDNITVGGVSIGERANNRMVGSSSLVWISVDYAAQNDLRDARSQMVAVEAGTFLDVDGNTNGQIIIQAAITG